MTVIIDTSIFTLINWKIPHSLKKIRELVENIYTNEYLNQITVNWNNELADADGENRTYIAERFLCKAYQLLKG